MQLVCGAQIKARKVDRAAFRLCTCRFANPLHTTGERFVWDYWHVPDQYTLLRTPADQFFPEEQYQQLEDALLDYGEEHLGCRGISPVWLSYYVDGCRQVSYQQWLVKMLGVAALSLGILP